MNDKITKTIWTVGHSTRTLEEVMEMLDSFQIKAVVDIRSYPGSRRYPHFNKEALEVSLPVNDVRYFHIRNLGGRRKAKADSKIQFGTIRLLGVCRLYGNGRI